MMTDFSRKQVFLHDDNVDLLRCQLQEICFFYKKKYNAELIKGRYAKNALIKTIRHYTKYLREFDCKVTSLDFYKSYAWLGYFMAEELNSQDMQYKMLYVAVWRLQKELENHGKNMDKCDKLFNKLLMLLQNEISQKGEFGVGKNGLYMIVKFVSLVDFN